MPTGAEITIIRLVSTMVYRWIVHPARGRIPPYPLPRLSQSTPGIPPYQNPFIPCPPLSEILTHFSWWAHSYSNSHGARSCGRGRSGAGARLFSSLLLFAPQRLARTAVLVRSRRLLLVQMLRLCLVLRSCCQQQQQQQQQHETQFSGDSIPWYFLLSPG